MQGPFAKTDKKIKLFVFPYAGGSAAAFNPWKSHIDAQIEFIPVELAGRGTRISEDRYQGLTAAVEDLFHIIQPQIQGHAYAFFGHSMGVRLAHELTKKMQDMNEREPNHLFYSGRGAVQVKRQDKKIYHLMPDEVFKQELMNLGGTPPEFFEYPELVEFFLPLMKSDFVISETELDLANFKPVNIDITVFNGTEDDITPEQHEGWKTYTNKQCQVHMYEGDHFFLNHKMKEMAQIINTTLSIVPTH